MIRKKGNKRNTILYILKMIKEGSSKEKPLTQATISRALSMLEIDCERKTVAKYVNALIEFGYNIIKLPGGGCYLDKKD